MGEDFYNKYILPYAGIIAKICRAYANTNEEYEDLYQEVCLQIWRCYDQFEGKAKWSTWVYRLSLNVCMTTLRTKKVKESVSEVDLVCEAQAVDQSLSHQQSLECLYQGIRQLTETDRALILLYLEEKSYLDIAEITGTNQNNIGVRINRIKSRLTKIISEKE